MKKILTFTLFTLLTGNFYPRVLFDVCNDTKIQVKQTTNDLSFTEAGKRGNDYSNKRNTFTVRDAGNNKNEHICESEYICVSGQNRSKSDLALEAIIRKRSQEKTSATMRAFDENEELYRIPTIIHIVHKGEALGTFENPSANDILENIHKANLLFRSASSDAEFTNPNYGADTRIMLEAATIDTLGNCFDGIVRHNLDYGIIGQSFSFQEILWDPSKYLNIVYYHSIGGIAGFAGPGTEAVVNNIFNSALIAHEVGHVFFLKHPYEGGCLNDNCLTDNDGICDTPPMASLPFGFGRCSTNSCFTDEDDSSANNPYRSVALGGLGDQPDVYDNIMGGVNCTGKGNFTQGQKSLMRSAIETIGYLDEPINDQCVPEEKPFIIKIDTRLEGGVTNNQSLRIKASYPSLFDVDWDNDGIYDDFGLGNETITHDFGSPGVYTVRLKGRFSRGTFNKDENLDCVKLIDIEQWGTTKWGYFSFNGCENMDMSAIDAPDLSFVNTLGSAFKDTNLGVVNFSDWDVSNVTEMASMFRGCTRFNSDLSGWDVSKVIDMRYLFENCDSLTTDMSNWDVSKVENISYMFSLIDTFAFDVSGWDISNVTDMSGTFSECGGMNVNLSQWDVSKVTTMKYTFNLTDFNGDISNWNVGNVTNMSNMFRFTKRFNGNLSTWDVSKVEDMSSMFSDAVKFNQDLIGWDVSNVTNMLQMFKGSRFFNGDISTWDISSVTDMRFMFYFSQSFNRDISNWDVSNVQLMRGMFTQAYNFNQNLGAWNLNVNGDFGSGMLASSGMQRTNYDETLIAWSTKTLPNNVDFNNNLSYCASEQAKNIITNTFNWDFDSDRKNCDCQSSPFVNTVLIWELTDNINDDRTLVLSPARINRNSWDDCDIVSMSLDKTTFSCSDLGAQQIVLTATDNDGLSTSKTVTYTITDEFGVCSCQDGISLSGVVTGDKQLSNYESIESREVIQSGEIKYTAQNSVHLLPGFEVKNVIGATNNPTFEASIQDCEIVSLKQNEEENNILDTIDSEQKPMSSNISNPIISYSELGNIPRQKVSVQPNPTKDIVIVSIEKIQHAAIIVYSTWGSLIHQRSIRNADEEGFNNITLSFENRPKGVYFINVIDQDTGKLFVKKIVKQ